MNIHKKGVIKLFKEDIIGNLVSGKQEVEIKWRAGLFIMDEPTFNGGKDLGPDPFTTILSALAGCTLTTLRMYMRRKNWEIPSMRVEINMSQQTEPFRTNIYRKVILYGSLTEEQHEKLLWIAKNCPVARLLEGEIEIETSL